MPEKKNSNISDHLANERTFLAWIRTAIGIMAFGFVVVKFSLFVRQLSIVLDKQVPALAGGGYSSIAGLGLVITGALVIVFAFARYKKTQKQINAEDFRQRSWLITIFTVFIFLMGLFLVVYLAHNI